LIAAYTSKSPAEGGAFGEYSGLAGVGLKH
jgi:hypothetical protein